jgi:hypothetical protein
MKCSKTAVHRKKKGQRSYYPFIPYEYGHDFKEIVTNKPVCAKKALSFHNGRGAQEGVFFELKSQTQMDYIPTRKKAGNQVYLLSAVLAHNLNREIQIPFWISRA